MTKPRFEDPRLTALNGESSLLQDSGMRQALQDSLEAGEVAKAAYSVSAHIWVTAVLTDRALLFVKGAVRAKVTRVPFPLVVIRQPGGTKQGARLHTPLGAKTLWGSKLDPEVGLLLGHMLPPADDSGRTSPRGESVPRDGATVGAGKTPATPGVGHDSRPARGIRLTRRERTAAKRLAGKKPRKPRRQKASSAWVGFAPSSTIWDISYNCIKCGRALTNPNSQRHRVGTDCIKRYGSQARKITNPAYADWSARKARADVDRVAQQVRHDADFERASAAYEEALATWRDVRAGKHNALSGVDLDPAPDSVRRQ